MVFNELLFFNSTWLTRMEQVLLLLILKPSQFERKITFNIVVARQFAALRLHDNFNFCADSTAQHQMHVHRVCL